MKAKKTKAAVRTKTGVTIQTKVALVVVMALALSGMTFSFAGILVRTEKQKVSTNRSIVNRTIKSVRTKPLGIIFVIDKSGSMGRCSNNSSYPPCPGGALTRLQAVKTSLITEIQNLFAKNPQAEVGLVVYDHGVHNYYTFRGSEYVNSIIATINNIYSGGGTEHAAALDAVKDMFINSARKYDQNVIVLITDGNCATCHPAAYGIAELIKYPGPPYNITGDIFTVTISTPDFFDNSLKGFMNALSSSGCEPNNYGMDRQGQCGGPNFDQVNCYSQDSVNNDAIFEQCDPAVDAGCISAGHADACRWDADNFYNNRAYNSNNIPQMIADVISSMPVGEITNSCGDGLCRGIENCVNCPVDCDQCPEVFME